MLTHADLLGISTERRDKYARPAPARKRAATAGSERDANDFERSYASRHRGHRPMSRAETHTRRPTSAKGREDIWRRIAERQHSRLLRPQAGEPEHLKGVQLARSLSGSL